MTTENPDLRSLGLGLPGVNDIKLYGWDLKTENLYSRAQKHRTCAPQTLELAADALKSMTPTPATLAGSAAVGEWIKKQSEALLAAAHQQGVQQIVLVNLLPTEPTTWQQDDSRIDWRSLRDVRADHRGVTPSRLYFRLAIEAGAHFVNFTPNMAETAGLTALAEEKKLLYCGRDGKTGQTYLKTVLAPAFRNKNFQLDGWFSTNLLGNSDGLNLSNPDSLLAKQHSKHKCLERIMAPQTLSDPAAHQVHIHYYPPRGDAKEAWDNIDLTGFLGETIQLKLNWLGKDSVLGAPAVLDLTRLTHAAAQRSQAGCLDALAFFFKDPVTGPMSEPVHSSPAQYQVLLRYLQSLAAPG